MGASTGRGGTVRAQMQLRQCFLSTQVHAMPHPELMVDGARERFADDGTLTDPATRQRVAQLLRALAQWTRQLRAPCAPA